MNKREHLLLVWQQLSLLVSEGNWNEESTRKEHELLRDLEMNLPFKNDNQHAEWLDVLFGYKFWEDFEEITMEIINQLGSVDDETFDAYDKVALDLAKRCSFKTLFDAFAKISDNWISPMKKWQQWWKHFSANEEDKRFYLDEYEEVYGKEFREEDLQEYYGFELCIYPMFYRDDEEGKSDLLDCIFERYIGGLNEEECLRFYKDIIKEILEDEGQL